MGEPVSCRRTTSLQQTQTPTLRLSAKTNALLNLDVCGSHILTLIATCWTTVELCPIVTHVSVDQQLQILTHVHGHHIQMCLLQQLLLQQLPLQQLLPQEQPPEYLYKLPQQPQELPQEHLYKQLLLPLL